MYSTYLGGTGADVGYGIAVDGNGATVTGSTSSANFPTTTGAFNTTYGGGVSNAFVTRVGVGGTTLAYSTYIGGSGTDVGYGVALDSSSTAYITGYTNSANFPTKTAEQPALKGDFDAFVTAILLTGKTLAYSTFLGGSDDDIGVGIAVDANKNAYMIGSTASPDYPTTPGDLQTTIGGDIDAMVTMLTPTGTKAYSTFLGGSADDFGLAIAVDSTGDAYIAGDTASTNFPTRGALQGTSTGAFNIFVAQLNPTATGPLGYSSYFGGSGFENGLRNCARFLSSPRLIGALARLGGRLHSLNGLPDRDRHGGSAQPRWWQRCVGDEGAPRQPALADHHLRESRSSDASWSSRPQRVREFESAGQFRFQYSSLLYDQRTQWFYPDAGWQRVLTPARSSRTRLATGSTSLSSRSPRPSRLMLHPAVVAEGWRRRRRWWWRKYNHRRAVRFSDKLDVQHPGHCSQFADSNIGLHEHF